MRAWSKKKIQPSFEFKSFIFEQTKQRRWANKDGFFASLVDSSVPGVLNEKEEVVKFVANRNTAGLLVFVTPAEATICATGTRGGLKLVDMVVSMGPCGV